MMSLWTHNTSSYPSRADMPQSSASSRMRGGPGGRQSSPPVGDAAAPWHCSGAPLGRGRAPGGRGNLRASPNHETRRIQRPHFMGERLGPARQCPIAVVEVSLQMGSRTSCHRRGTCSREPARRVVGSQCGPDMQGEGRRVPTSRVSQCPVFSGDPARDGRPVPGSGCRIFLESPPLGRRVRANPCNGAPDFGGSSRLCRAANPVPRSS